VLDGAGAPVVGATVTFTPISGGSVSNPTATANQLGEASTSWTLGAAVGQQWLQAAIGPVAGTFVANALPPFPARPDTVIKVSGDAPCLTAGDTMIPSPTVLVKDQYGNPFPGARVAFTHSTGGGGILVAEPSTDDRGLAVSGPWVPRYSGSNELTARVDADGVGGNPIFFNAFVFPPTRPDTVIKAAPDGSRWPAVLVRDVLGNPAVGVVVTFANTKGDGSVIGPVQATDSRGIAVVGSWVVSTSGDHELTATVASPVCTIRGNPVTFTWHVP
jgi:hypothetical protein